MGLLQAPTTQNDLVRHVLKVLAFAYFAMRHIRGDGPTDWAATGATGLGLAILTKPTALFAAFPFVIWVVAGTCLSLTRRKILQIASLLILDLTDQCAADGPATSMPTGHPFGSDTHRSVVTLRGSWVRLSRIQFSPPLLYALQVFRPSVRNMTNRWLEILRPLWSGFTGWWALQ